MSSSYTLVSCERWQSIQRDIANAEAYVINRQQEAERIRRLADERRRNNIRIQEENRRNLNAAVDSLRNMYTANANRLANQSRSHIQGQIHDFERQVDEVRSAVNSANVRIQALDERINGIARSYNEVFQEFASQEIHEKERYEAIVNELDSLIERIEGLSPQRFAPREYEALALLRTSISTNGSVGDYQAALLVSQDSILDASRLYARLLVMNESYNSRHLEVSNRFAELKERIDRLSSKDGVLTVQDGNLEFDYDISFWSNGQFDDIVSQTANMETLLQSGTLSREELEQIAHNIEVLDENLSACDAMARRERAGAVVAGDMAVQLYDALTGCGWRHVDSGYHNNDERNPYSMVLEDGSGNVISVVVAPDSPETPSVAFEVFSDDEEIANITRDGVQASLEAEDICIEHSERRDDCHLNPDADTFIAHAAEEAMEYINQRRQEQMINLMS